MATSIPAAELPVRLVVLNHNGGDLTRRCLRAILGLDWPAHLLQVVCLDNDSTDGSADRIEKDFPQVNLRRLGTNRGFPANNEALGYLDQVRYVGLVNNDAFVEPEWLSELVAALDADRGLGAVCPKILLEPRYAAISIRAPQFDAGSGDRRSLGLRIRSVRVAGVDVSASAHLGGSGWGREHDAKGPFEWSRPDAVLYVPTDSEDESLSIRLGVEMPRAGRVSLDGGAGSEEFDLHAGSHDLTVELTGPRFDLVNGVGCCVSLDGYGSDRGWLQIDEGQFDDPADVFAWSGGGVLMRPQYLSDVGLFEERFFLYYEDTDLSWRGRSRGWRYRTVPSARMRHVHAASTVSASGLAQRLAERNRLLMLVRNGSWKLALSQVLRFPFSTASYVRRDVVHPMVSGDRPITSTVTMRLRAFAGFLRLLPAALAGRRDISRRRILPVAEVEGALTDDR